MVTIKVDLQTYLKIKEFYSPYIYKENDGYIDYVACKDDILITGYLSNKKKKSITFNGKNEEIEATKWEEIHLLENKKEDEPKMWIDIEEQIGSDEVGVGDFCLPMIVVAAYVKPSQIKRLRELGVNDSKKMSDLKIREIGPFLVKEFKFSKLTLPNQKYNEMVLKKENINSLKAKMHNRALSNLHKEYLDIQRIYVDQFCSEKNYYSYLDKNDEPIVKDIAFKTKGESYFPSVALASVIARYAFLLEKDKLSEKYGLNFLSGASNKVDQFAKKLLDKVGKEEFDHLVKKNFKNYQRVVDSL